MLYWTLTLSIATNASWETLRTTAIPSVMAFQKPETAILTIYATVLRLLTQTS